MTQARTINPVDPVTVLLIQHFAAWEPERFATYDSLAGVVGFDVWHERPHLVRSARRIVQRDYGVVIGVVRGEGLRCLPNRERAAIPAAGVQSCRRAARRASAVVDCVDALALDRDDRHKLDTSLVQLSLIQSVSSHTTRRVLKAERPDLDVLLSVVKPT